MSDMTLQAVERRKKRRDRWMPGNAAELLRRGAAVAVQVLPGFLLSFAEVLGMPAGMQAGWLAAMAVMEQEGVCGLSTGIGSDIAEMLGMKSAAKGVRIVSDKEGRLFVECNVVANFGYSVFELAKNVQENVKSSVESVTGLRVAEVNVTVCGIALPKDSKK